MATETMHTHAYTHAHRCTQMHTQMHTHMHTHAHTCTHKLSEPPRQQPSSVNLQILEEQPRSTHPVQHSPIGATSQRAPVPRTVPRYPRAYPALTLLHCCALLAYPTLTRYPRAYHPALTRAPGAAPDVYARICMRAHLCMRASVCARVCTGAGRLREQVVAARHHAAARRTRVCQVLQVSLEPS